MKCVLNRHHTCNGNGPCRLLQYLTHFLSGVVNASKPKPLEINNSFNTKWNISHTDHIIWLECPFQKNNSVSKAGLQCNFLDSNLFLTRCFKGFQRFAHSRRNILSGDNYLSLLLDAAGRGRSLSFSSSGLCSSHIFLTMRWSVPVYHLHLAVCPPWSHAEWCLMGLMDEILTICFTQVRWKIILALTAKTTRQVCTACFLNPLGMIQEVVLPGLSLHALVWRLGWPEILGLPTWQRRQRIS